MFQNDPLKVLTGKVRLSYVHLIRPYSPVPGAEPKYSVTLLIPKEDKAMKAQIDLSMEAAVQHGMSHAWNGQRPDTIRLPLYDGDGERPSGGPFREECRGHWVLTASCKQKPEVLALTGSPIEDEAEIYSGIYARVTFRFFAYSSGIHRGIGAGLGNILKLSDGEPLSARRSASMDFAGILKQASGR